MREVKARVLGLRAELRRLLILVDGNVPLSRLAIFVRGSEIDYLIAELEIQGLVTTGMGAPISFDERINAPSVAASAVPLAPTPMPAPALALSASASVAEASTNVEPTKSQMLAVRRMAVSTLHDLLGPDADALAVKIERCKDAKELRVVITDIRQTLDRQIGTESGQRFLDAVRTAAEGTR